MANIVGADESNETKDKRKGESIPWSLEKHSISNQVANRISVSRVKAELERTES